MKTSYELVTSQELATGFRFVDIRKSGQVTARPGFVELEVVLGYTHSQAVKAMLRGHKDMNKYNVAVDSNYIPPSKRKLT